VNSNQSYAALTVACARSTRRLFSAWTAAGVLALLGGALFGPSTAVAGSGNFCTACVVKPHNMRVGNFRGTWIETETWNSDGKGVGSCTGVGNGAGSWANIVCHGDATGYNEVYCTGCNGYHNSYAQLENNSNHGYTSVFTGWEWYS
jgi:hypothetical protein